MFRPCFRKHRLFWKAQRSSNLRLDLPFASQDLRLGLLFAEINLLSTHGIQLTDASLSEIGHEFGGKHHTTVTHSIVKIHQLRATDAGLNRTIETLLGRLRSAG